MAAVPATPGGLRGAVDLSPLVNRQAAPPARRRDAAPADGAEPGDAPLVVEVGDSDLQRLIDVSASVPVLVALVAEWSTPSQQLLPVLQSVVTSLAGQVLLAIVDQPANPQLSGAFQAQSVPTVSAIIAGSPVPLFQGSIDEDRLRALLDRLLELAAQNGVSGRLNGGAPADDAPEAEPVPVAEPPLHFEAYEAIEKQDYAEAARLFRLAIAQDPHDTQAVAALAQVELLDRVSRVPEGARDRAAGDFRDLDAALGVADLDIAGGHVDDAFDRLLGLIPSVHGDDRNLVRTRLLDYFEIVGTDDPRVAPARRRLAMLLY